MLKTLTRFPTKHVEENLCFSVDGRVWLGYEVEGFEYDFHDESTKKGYFLNQTTLFTHLECDLHLLVIPRTTNSDEILDEHIESISGPMAPTGRWLFGKMKQYLKRSAMSTENTEYHFYILVQVNEEKKQKQARNPIVETAKFAKRMRQGFTNAAHEAIGLHESDILEDEIEEYKDMDEVIHGQLINTFKFVNRLTAPTLKFLIEQNFTRGMTEPERVKEWNIGETIELFDSNGKPKKVRRTRMQEIVKLTDCLIDESPGRSLILERQNEDGDLEKMHVAFLAVKSMPEESIFPGLEWIYRIQSHSLKFPVEISIRAHHMDNEIVTKQLTNSELELNDQRRQAMVGGKTTDLTIDRKVRGVKHVQDRFQTTGMPGYEMSVLFCVYAENKKTLQTRINALISEYKKMRIELVNPFGDQLAYFYEFLPGSHRYNTDFKLYVEPGVLAQGMFGATTQIGDNKGFYLGRTAKLNRPVFIKPDLAAKALENIANEFDSLSVMIAGQTGKGKSFLLNLLVYWIVMSGGRAFVGDPKGDRGDWPIKLPGFKKDQLEVWTLGASAEDAGCLDPFRICSSIEEAKRLSLELLSFLANANLEDSRYDYLVDAITEVTKLENPCLTLVKEQLKEKKNRDLNIMSEKALDSLNSLIHRLETIEKTPLAELLFGKPGQNYRVLSLERPLQVLQIQHLQLPDSKKPAVSIIDKLSESVLIAMTAFGKSLMNSDRKVFKVYVQDEAASVLKNSEGSRLSDDIIRKGRYHNTGLYLSTQNASDFNSENREVANVGMKFSFAMKYDKEAEEMLSYYNLPITDENVSMMKKLKRGQCLFQDIYGRTAIINVDPVFKELLTAFDTSTKSDEERELQSV